MRSCSEFLIPSEELFSFMRGIRRDSRQFLGIYHSHTQRDASPSERDIRDLHYPEVTYWIISTWKAVEVRCYRFLEGRFEPVSYRVARD
jgi:proteasome lid subunit RPN8/RPN11